MNDKKFVCDWCHKTFSSKTNLNVHNKNAKYCLDIKGGNIDKYQCKWCNTICSSPNYLNKHIKNCVKKVELELEESKKDNKKYKKEIKTLNKKILELENKSLTIINNSNNTTNITNNITYILNNVNIDHIEPLKIRDVKEYEYSMETFLGGPEAHAKLMMDMFNKEKNIKGKLIKSQNYVCTDTIENIFYRLIKKVPEKKWTEDCDYLFLNSIIDQWKDEASSYYYTLPTKQKKNADNKFTYDGILAETLDHRQEFIESIIQYIKDELIYSSQFSDIKSQKLIENNLLNLSEKKQINSKVTIDKSTNSKSINDKKSASVSNKLSSNKLSNKPTNKLNKNNDDRRNNFYGGNNFNFDYGYNDEIPISQQYVAEIYETPPDYRSLEET